MNRESWLKSSIEYGCDIVRSALEGARSAGEQMRDAEPSCFRTALAPSTTAACLGLVAGYVVTKRRSAHNAAGFSVLGAVIGFAGGVAWSTRHISRRVARGAIKKINATRDAHWLVKNPIDYA
jgi:hypothetical protein